jgi:hypothetical protein
MLYQIPRLRFETQRLHTDFNETSLSTAQISIHQPRERLKSHSLVQVK